MGTYRQRFLHDLPTLETFLRGEVGTHSYHLMTSSFSLFTQDIEKCAPTGVHDALCQGVILDHVENNQVLNSDDAVLFRILLSRLIVIIPSLPLDLEMRLRRATSCLSPAMTALFAPRYGALFAPECFLRGAIETRVLNSMPLAIGQERFQTHVDSNSRMLTGTWRVLNLRFSFADNQSVPMPIGTVNEMNCFRRAHNRAMQLDLEGMPHLLRYNEVFLVLMQIAIFAILPELDGMPPIGRLPTGKADTRNVILFGGKKAFEGLGETISEHLHGCGWYVLTLAFECRFKLILAWKHPVLRVVCLDGLKHPIVNGASLCQASHKLARLFLIHEQAVLECSHENILPQAIRKVKRFAPAGGGFSPPCINAGALKPRLVDCPQYHPEKQVDGKRGKEPSKIKAERCMMAHDVGKQQ